MLVTGSKRASFPELITTSLFFLINVAFIKVEKLVFSLSAVT
jgi:hypothetical protein